MLLIIILGIILISVSFFIWMHSTSLNKNDSDTLIILGYRCINNIIHPLLEERLKAGKELADSITYKKIILTGGKVASDISEAIIMKDYLIENGISEECITLEMEANDTIENMVNCIKIMQKNKLTTCTVISNSFHLRRILYICDRLNFPVSVYCKRDFKILLKQIKLTFSEARIFIFVFLALKKLGRS